MASFKSFTEIIAWQKARELSKLIFDLTTNGSFSKGLSLKDQVNRATGSIMDNIVEGHERGSKNEFVNMLTYSKGSAGETLSQLFRALDREHITQDQFNGLEIQDRRDFKNDQRINRIFEHLQHTGLQVQEPGIVANHKLKTLNSIPGTTKV